MMSAPPPAVDLGTTLVAIVFDQGVVVGADTRTSIGGGLSYVSHRSTPNKIVQLDQHLVLARSGHAANTQQVAHAARRHVLTRIMYNNSSNLSRNKKNKAAAFTVAQMAHWLQNCVYELANGDGGNGAASFLLAGCDWERAAAVDDNDDNNKNKHPTVVHPRIYVIAPSGACWSEERFAAAGSGSSFILGFLDHAVGNVQSSSGISIQQDKAVSLCRQALSLAMARDGSSGGVCRIFVVTAHGCTEMVLPPLVAAEPGGDDTRSDMAKVAKCLTGFAPAAASTRTSNAP